jgi:hypothetical protein
MNTLWLRNVKLGFSWNKVYIKTPGMNRVPTYQRRLDLATVDAVGWMHAQEGERIWRAVAGCHACAGMPLMHTTT